MSEFAMKTCPAQFEDLRSIASPSMRSNGRPPRRAFTLVEMLIVIAIISTLMSISTYAFSKARETNVLAQARNAVLTYAKLARSYAIANQIETMMVVNPFNGRFEIWHLNPPPGGGPWDPLSSGTAIPFTDGYACAPVLDSGARLPVDANGRPLAVVHPIDFGDDETRPYLTDNDQNFDNNTWAAFCFDKTGKLVVRTRRIATRTYTLRDGTTRNAADRNRLIDESPDFTVFDVPPFVMVRGGASPDTPITSTLGFVISEGPKMRQVLGPRPTSLDIVNNWLIQTRPGGRYADFADTVLLNRYTGDDLVGAF